ncbi:uncharacterized protein MKZ38_003214 [Zalerion maritima]|uniref:Zn(2)-C6 fungal-type domain-containing protein n=1 Tax=Zalerion maritima TaxID=339359 RepID=A0AAD5S6K5_9PEZI|nr:uncharacterized protein MKZ38_003214 [Zalerion maritima]
MLSNPLHRFSPYHTIPSNTLLSNGHVPTTHIHASGLDTLAPGSHYALQQLQQHVGAPNPHLARPGSQAKHRQHPYGPGGRAAGAAGPIRRRISRACDQCNQLRTKCDGQHPCAHCIEFGLGCEYIRERKKRGKASRKDLAQQAAAQAAATAAQSGQKSPIQEGDSRRTGKKQQQHHQQRAVSSTGSKQSMGDPSPTLGPADKVMDMGEELLRQQQRTPSIDTLGEMGGGMDRSHHLESPTTPLDLNSYGYDGRPDMGAPMMNSAPHAQYSDQGAMSNYPEIPYPIQTQSPTNYNNNFRMGAPPLGAYPMAGENASPGGWMSMSSPPQQYQTLAQDGFGAHPRQQPPQQPQQPQQQNCRYPVLEPVIPHLGNIIPIPLACDLIELYFASSSSAKMHPMSPYVLGFVFRKRSFLNPNKPRQCQPALLASMLWVGAQTSDAPFLTSVPSARGKICQKLLELAVSLLKPLIHTPSGEASPVSSPVVDGVALGGLGVAMPGTMSMDALSGESGPFGAAGCLDDVITYIHLATVVSASEYKGASLRWWNAAWSLARELKLGRELPYNQRPGEIENEAEGDSNGCIDSSSSAPGVITEEEREERRRIWWLCYITDRHLALCYNRPLFLLDLECDNLLQPMDDTAWQNGEFGASSAFTTVGVTDPNMIVDGQHQQQPQQQGHAQSGQRVRGPSFECTGHSVFGYFLPLMTILGEIVDLHHARNHPRFGVGFRSAGEWDDQASEICRHLEVYEQSLKRFEARHLGCSNSGGNQDGSGNGEEGDNNHDVGTPNMSVHSVRTSSSRLTESEIQTRIVMAYGTHVMRVLHILLAGKWDPINLLDDNDLWISSQGFITAAGHAVSAAEAIGYILEYDPGLEFMPFVFGIYLLQGSFLLLLIADKLQLEASPSVVRACETIIRAHEACVVTLSTEYQRNFSKVMRSALAQVRGRVPEDLEEQHQRRRELLALYRWTGDGTGLAL